MRFFELLSYLLHFYVPYVYCHGDHSDKPKLILISMNLNSSFLYLNSITSKLSFIELPFKVNATDTIFDSILNGCNNGKTYNCEPIWVINQLNNFESAIIDWPNQLVYNETTWPTFSFGCNSQKVSLNLKLNRIINWMKRPKTSLGIMYISLYSDNDKSNVEYFTNFISTVNDHKWNLIVVSFEMRVKIYKFLAFGPKFLKPNNSLTISQFDIKLLIENILDLKTLNHYDSQSKNSYLQSMLINSENHRNELGFLKFVYISTLIGSAVIIASAFIIAAAKSSCINKQKLNHQYNLGLNDISITTGYPENAYLLNGSDDDDLFSDAVPHIQTTTLK